MVEVDMLLTRLGWQGRSLDRFLRWLSAPNTGPDSLPVQAASAPRHCGRKVAAFTSLGRGRPRPPRTVTSSMVKGTCPGIKVPLSLPDHTHGGILAGNKWRAWILNHETYTYRET